MTRTFLGLSAALLAVTLLIGQEKQPTAPDGPTLILDIDARGGVTLPGGKKPIPVGDELRKALETELKRLAARQKGEPTVILRAHPDVEYNPLFAVAKLCSDAGVRRLKIRVAVGKPEHDLELPKPPSAPPVIAPPDEIPEFTIELRLRLDSDRDPQKKGQLGRLVLSSDVGLEELLDLKDWERTLRKQLDQLRRIDKDKRPTVRMLADEDLHWGEFARVLGAVRQMNCEVVFGGHVEEPDLLNLDLSIEPELPLNFDVDRIKEVDVPGPVDPGAARGIIGAPEGPPVDIPPPPGLGRVPGGDPELPGLGGLGSGTGGLRPVPGGFGGRKGATREKAAIEGGGSAASEAAVAKGLRWLALHQAPEGHWSLDKFPEHARRTVTSREYVNDGSTGRGMQNDTGGTAFGLLPFLAAGITHKPSGRPVDDQYVRTVERGLKWLVKQQGKDGGFPGGMYAQGLATAALCEAYGMTSDPNLRLPAQAALNYIIMAQHPQGGGWRYQPRQSGDTSVTGWQVMALKSGQMAGLNVPKITLDGARKWLDSCETEDGGKFGYIGPKPTPTMTAVGLLCRQYLGAPARDPKLVRGVRWIWQTAPPSNTISNLYYEYYATQVFHHMGGEAWDYWNGGFKDEKTGKPVPGMRDLLIARQDKDGSWDPEHDNHGSRGGRIMTTSLSLLTLEVYYRHLPLYRRSEPQK